VYLKKIRLQNIKCFEDVTLEFPNKDGDYSGWNVILGENGLGKSTLVRAMAELVMSLNYVNWLRDDEWVADRSERGKIEAEFLETRFDDPELRGKGATRHPTIGLRKQLWLEARIEPLGTEVDNTTRRPKKANTPGWLACGYGPFRRLDWQPAAFQRSPYEVPFLTILNDSAGIAEPISWLKTIYARSLDKKVAGSDVFRQTLPLFEKVINQLLPESPNTRLKDISTERVLFETAEGVELEAIHLSDGFRSFLALVLDLLMHVYNATSRFLDYVAEDKETGTISILAEGIVLIDEADAHLHPSWQRELGERLRQVFPKIQFIVTTHSPFIAQEAIDGGLFVLSRNEKGSVEVTQPIESVRGWTATQILTSPRLFGLHSTRSVETESLIRRNAELLSKQNAGKLTAAEKRELKAIRETLEQQLSAPGETYDEMNRQRDIQQYIDESLKALKNGKS